MVGLAERMPQMLATITPQVCRLIFALHNAAQYWTLAAPLTNRPPPIHYVHRLHNAYFIHILLARLRKFIVMAMNWMSSRRQLKYEWHVHGFDRRALLFACKQRQNGWRFLHRPKANTATAVQNVFQAWVQSVCTIMASLVLLSHKA